MTPLHSRILRLVLALAWFALPACTTTRSERGERVYFPHTTAYEKKLGTLKLTKAQAKECLRKYARATHDHFAHPDSETVVIVGDSFVFSNKEKDGVSLNGCFVDGNTGTVTRRHEGKVYLPFGLEPFAIH